MLKHLLFVTLVSLGDCEFRPAPHNDSGEVLLKPKLPNPPTRQHYYPRQNPFYRYSCIRSSDGKCSLAYNEYCESTIDCFTGLVCTNGKCDCPFPSHQFYQQNGSACVSYGLGPCLTHVDGVETSFNCVENAKCVNSSGYYECRCEEGFMLSQERKCKIGHEQPCRGNNSCDSLAGLVCRNQTCSCPLLYEYDDKLKVCKGITGAICSSTEDCTDGAVCVTFRDERLEVKPDCGRKVEGICKRIDDKAGRLEIIKERSSLFALVQKMVEEEKLPSGDPRFELIQVELLQNPTLLRDFVAARTKIMRRNNGLSNEKMLFHGTSAIKYIIQGGFDVRYAKEGTFGYGIYFSANLSVANNYVCGRTGCADEIDVNCTTCYRKVLIADVALGKSYNDSEEKKWAHSPLGHDSVLGFPKDQPEEYVVYKEEQAFPGIVATYKVNQSG